MPAFDHFRFIAPFYDRIFAGLRLDRLKELLPISKGGWLLDVGGGTGRATEGLQGTVSPVVLDVSGGMLRQAQSKGLITVQGEAEALPFRSQAFPHILMVDTFHHLRDQEGSVAELLRVLAPGGWLVVQEPNIERPAIKLIALGEKLLLMRSRFRPPDAMRRMFEAAGGQVRMKQEGIDLWLIVERNFLEKGAASPKTSTS